MSNQWDLRTAPDFQNYPPISISFTTRIGEHRSPTAAAAAANPANFYTRQPYAHPSTQVWEAEDFYPHVRMVASTQLQQHPRLSGTTDWMDSFSWHYAAHPPYSSASVFRSEATTLRDVHTSQSSDHSQNPHLTTDRHKKAIIYLVCCEGCSGNTSIRLRYTKTRDQGTTRSCSSARKNIEITTLDGSSNVLIVKLLAPKVNRHLSREGQLPENDADTVKKIEQAIKKMREASPLLPKGRKVLILLCKTRTELQHALEGLDHLKQDLRQCLGILDSSVNPLDYCVFADGSLKRHLPFGINDDDLRVLLQCCRQGKLHDKTATTHEQKQKQTKSKSKPTKRSSRTDESVPPVPKVDLAIVKRNLQEQLKVWYPDVLEQTYVPSVTFKTVDRTEQDGDVGSKSTAKDNLELMKLLSAKLGEGQSTSSELQESDYRDEQTQHLVLRSLLRVCTKQKEVMFVLSQVNYRTYLNEPAYVDMVLALPRPVGLKPLNMHRGDFDILIIHRQYGILVGEVKSIGNNFDSIALTEEEQDRIVDKRIHQALKQLNKAVQVLRHLMSDLAAPPRVIKTVMLPCISKHQLHRVLRVSESQIRMDLCECLGLDAVGDPSGLCLTSDDIMNPSQWWQRCMVESGDDQAMTADIYLDLVSRFAGPATTAEPCYQRATDFEAESSPELVFMEEEAG